MEIYTEKTALKRGGEKEMFMCLYVWFEWADSDARKATGYAKINLQLNIKSNTFC